MSKARTGVASKLPFGSSGGRGEDEGEGEGQEAGEEEEGATTEGGEGGEGEEGEDEEGEGEGEDIVTPVRNLEGKVWVWGQPTGTQRTPNLMKNLLLGEVHVHVHVYTCTLCIVCTCVYVVMSWVHVGYHKLRLRLKGNVSYSAHHITVHILARKVCCMF